MRRVIGLLAAVLVIAAPARAASVVRVTAGPADVQALASQGFDVTENVKPGYADVVVHSGADLRRLRAAGFAFRRLPRVRDRAVAAATSALPSGRRTYRRYSDYLHDLTALPAAHPGLARPVTLPVRSVLGRPIVGVELAAGVDRTDDGRPVYLVLGDHHARDWPSAEIAMEFAIDLAKGYGRDPRITSLLDRERVIVVPIVNPDGFLVSRDDVRSDRRFAATAHGGLMKRKNCAADTPLEASEPCRDRAGVDLNRNYGAGWGGPGASLDYTADDYRGPGPWSEPETRAVHELSQGLPVTGVQTLHNYAGLVLRPPGARVLGVAPDEARLKRLGDAMARATGYVSEHGYDLYEVTGATEDWNYAAQGAFGYTIELGGTSFQDPYQAGVVDQYFGRPGTPAAGRGVREALLLAGEEAADPADHAIVAGTAPAGRVLRLHKDFTTATSPVCPNAITAGPGTCTLLLEPLQIDDHLDTTMTVPASGRFVWNVGPSTGPWDRRAGRTDAWTLTCETPDGQVLDRRSVVVGRGETATVALGCGSGEPSSGPVVAPTAPDSASAGFESRLRDLTAGAPRGARLVARGVAAIRVATLRRSRALRVGLRVSGTVLHDVTARLRAPLRGVVAAGRLAVLRGRGRIVLRLPHGLSAGRYRLTVRGYAPNGAPVSAARRIIIVRR